MKHVTFSDMTVEQFQFTDEPIYCTSDEYENTKFKIVDFYSRLKGVISIYQMGSITVPGISDLDIIIVLNEEAPKRDYSYKTFLSRKEQYIVAHSTPSIINRHIFKQLNTFFYPSNPTLLWGKNITFQKYSEAQNAIFKLSYSIDAALTALIWLLNTLFKKSIPLRNSLCHLNSTKFDFNNLSNITGIYLRKGKELDTAITELRKTWFLQSNVSKLSSIINLQKKACESLPDVIEELGNYLKKAYLKGLDGMCDSDCQFYLSGLNYLFRFKNGSKKYIRLLVPFKNRFLLTYMIDLPLPIGVQFFLYASHRSKLGQELRRHLNIKTHYLKFLQAPMDEFKNVLFRKMDILENYTQFLLRFHAGISLISGVWFGRSRLHKIKSIFWNFFIYLALPYEKK